jgi:hypothetical protein
MSANASYGLESHPQFADQFVGLFEAAALDIGATAFVTHDRDFTQVTGVNILMGDTF